MNKKRVLISLISLFLLPAVHALDSPGNFGDFLSSIGKIFHDLISNPYTLFFIIGIFLFVLLYAIIHAATKKVTFLEGKSGKMVAVSIAGMSDLAILYSMRNIPIEQHLANIMGPFGLFAGIAIAAVTFLGLRKLTGAKLALFLTGVVLIILATTLNIPSLILGGAALIIASALWLAKGMGSHASSSGPSFMDRFREERKKIKHIDKKERKLKKKAKKDRKKQRKNEKKQFKNLKEEYKLYQQLLKLINEQKESGTPLEYSSEIIETIKEFVEELGEDIQLEIKEEEEVREEKKLEKKERRWEKIELKEEQEAEEKFKKLGEEITEELKEKEEEEQDIGKLEKKDIKLIKKEAQVLERLKQSNRNIYKLLMQVKQFQTDLNPEESHNSAKDIKKWLEYKAKLEDYNKKLLKKRNKLWKKIKKLEKKEKKGEKGIKKEVSEEEKTIEKEEKDDIELPI